MRFLNYLFKWFFNINTILDLFSDVRTVCATILMVGGVSRFFGFHDTHYVTIYAFIGWIIANMSLTFLRGK